MFRQSFVKIFEKDTSDDLLMGFGASLGVLTTKELKVTGLIDYVVSMNKKSTSVGETERGIGNPAPRRCVVSAPLPQSQLTLRLHRKRDLPNTSKGLKRVSYVPDLTITNIRQANSTRESLPSAVTSAVLPETHRLPTPSTRRLRLCSWPGLRFSKPKMMTDRMC